MAKKVVLESLRVKMRTENKERWAWERPVVVKKDFDLRRSEAARLLTLKTPG